MCGNTALREIIQDASLEMVTVLLNAGADPRIPDWMQLTALDVAAQRYREKGDNVSRQVLNALIGVTNSDQ